MNAFMTLTRVLYVAGLAVTLLSLWQRRRLEKFLIARVSKSVRGLTTSRPHEPIHARRSNLQTDRLS
jgi:hypothetical protein